MPRCVTRDVRDVWQSSAVSCKAVPCRRSCSFRCVRLDQFVDGLHAWTDHFPRTSVCVGRCRRTQFSALHLDIVPAMAGALALAQSRVVALPKAWLEVTYQIILIRRQILKIKHSSLDWGTVSGVHTMGNGGTDMVIYSQPCWTKLAQGCISCWLDGDVNRGKESTCSHSVRA